MWRTRQSYEILQGPQSSSPWQAGELDLTLDKAVTGCFQIYAWDRFSEISSSEEDRLVTVPDFSCLFLPCILVSISPVPSVCPESHLSLPVLSCSLSYLNSFSLRPLIQSLPLTWQTKTDITTRGCPQLLPLNLTNTLTSAPILPLKASLFSLPPWHLSVILAVCIFNPFLKNLIASSIYT